jgi:hypothetical protein
MWRKGTGHAYELVQHDEDVEDSGHDDNIETAEQILVENRPRPFWQRHPIAVLLSTVFVLLCIGTVLRFLYVHSSFAFKIPF